MKKLFISTFLAIFSLLMMQTVSAQQSSMAQKHNSLGMTCMQCHNEATPKAALEINCSQCHGSSEDVAKLTEARFKEYYNPHNPLHYGTFAECANCHKQHTESRLDCSNSNCHKEFQYQVP